MKRLITIKFLLISFLFTSVLTTQAKDQNTYFIYEVDLTNHEDDIFHVKFYTGQLSPENKKFNFVAYAPGVHQTLDYGRLVEWLKAFDKDENEIPCEKISTNVWEISEPEKVYYIQYDIDDSFDEEFEEHDIYPMSGTGIEEDFIVLNNFGVFGYFDEYKDKPVKLKVNYDNSNWLTGTSLDLSDDGYYYADSYYELADSPILMGDLTYTSTKVGGIDVEVFCSSPDTSLNANLIMGLAEDVLKSAGEFLQFDPVDRYSFLMYLFDQESIKRNNFKAFGALEHSYSTTVALPAVKNHLGTLKESMAHEFMHILTPLNLHSEILANYDYSTPTVADKHLWLYEGVTEWVSDVMTFRSGLISIDEYLKGISQKIGVAKNFNSDYSIARLGAEWNTKEGNKQYGNIYFLGALTAGMLDIKLLELSSGKKGLREVYLELINKYGKDKPFNNDTFIDEVVSLTYPEIRTFFDNFIFDNQQLNYNEYFSLLGINYIEERISPDNKPQFGLGLGSRDGEHVSIESFSENHENFGLEVGDVILKVFGEEIKLSNYQEFIDMKNNMKPGDKYEITVKRGDEEFTFEGTLFLAIERDVLQIDPEATPKQKALRDSWSKNL